RTPPARELRPCIDPDARRGPRVRRRRRDPRPRGRPKGTVLHRPLPPARALRPRRHPVPPPPGEHPHHLGHRSRLHPARRATSSPNDRQRERPPDLPPTLTTPGLPAGTTEEMQVVFSQEPVAIASPHL